MPLQTFLRLGVFSHSEKCYILAFQKSTKLQYFFEIYCDSSAIAENRKGNRLKINCLLLNGAQNKTRTCTP